MQYAVASARVVVDLATCKRDAVERAALRLLRAVALGETGGRCPWCNGELAFPYGSREIQHGLPACPTFACLAEGGPEAVANPEALTSPDRVEGQPPTREAGRSLSHRPMAEGSEP